MSKPIRVLLTLVFLAENAGPGYFRPEIPERKDAALRPVASALRGAVMPKIEQMEEEIAERTAQKLNDELIKRNITITSPPVGKKNVVVDSSLGKAYKYLTPRINLVYFPDLYNNDSGCFALIDNQLQKIIGYGTNIFQKGKVFYRFRVFPTYEKEGRGSSAFRLIIYFLYDYYARILKKKVEKIVFPSLIELTEETAKAALESGLPQFLLKRGCVKEPRTRDLTKCDFVLKLEKSGTPLKGTPLNTGFVRNQQILNVLDAAA